MGFINFLKDNWIGGGIAVLSVLFMRGMFMPIMLGATSNVGAFSFMDILLTVLIVISTIVGFLPVIIFDALNIPLVSFNIVLFLFGVFISGALIQYLISRLWRR